MKTYVVDDKGNKEAVDWYDFMTNNNNHTLKRLGEQLENDPEFQKLMKEKGWDDEHFGVEE